MHNYKMIAIHQLKLQNCTSELQPTQYFDHNINQIAEQLRFQRWSHKIAETVNTFEGPTRVQL